MKSAARLISLLIGITSSWVFASAQGIVSYLDSNKKPTAMRDYTYKRVVKSLGAIIIPETRVDNTGNSHVTTRIAGYNFSITDYYKSGEPEFVVGGYSTEMTGSHYIYQGKAVWYYKSGATRMEGIYGTYGLQGYLNYFNENGTFQKRETYQNGKRILENKFPVTPNHLLIGTWRHVRFSKLTLPGMNPMIEFEYYAIINPDSILEIRYPPNSFSPILSSPSEFYNWKHVSQGGKPDIFEQYLGDELVIRLRIRFIDRNNFEFTILLHPDSGRIGETLLLTRQ